MNSEWLPAISWEIASPPVIVTSLPLPIGWSLLWGVKGRPSMIWLRDCSTPSLLIIHLFLISRAVSIFTALFSSSLFLSWAVKLLLLPRCTAAPLPPPCWLLAAPLAAPLLLPCCFPAPLFCSL